MIDHYYLYLVMTLILYIGQNCTQLITKHTKVGQELMYTVHGFHWHGQSRISYTLVPCDMDHTHTRHPAQLIHMGGMFSATTWFPIPHEFAGNQRTFPKAHTHTRGVQKVRGPTMKG